MTGLFPECDLLLIANYWTECVMIQAVVGFMGVFLVVAQSIDQMVCIGIQHSTNYATEAWIR